MKEFITCQMATIPSRMAELSKVIDSILPQVDRLNVMLNGHSIDDAAMIKNKYNGKPVTFRLRDNQMTDGEKHYNIENQPEGYIFTIDDDLIYPSDYVEYLISKIEQYERKAVISLHGRVFSELPIYSFYRDRAEMYRCMETVRGDHRADCAGDGVMAYHTDTFRMRYEWVELPNMSQLWVALACNRLGVPQIVVEHDGNYLEALLVTHTIWDTHNQSDGVQTNLINTRWKK